MNFFISPQGLDTNSGTSEQQPWRSLSAIRRIPAGINAVTLADGIYRESLPLASGLTVRARNPGKVILDGSSQGNPNWLKGSDGIWRSLWTGGAPFGLWLGTFEQQGSFCTCYDGAYAGFDLARPGGIVIPGSKSQWRAVGGNLELTTIGGGNPRDEGLKIATGNTAITATGLVDVHVEGVAARYWRRMFEAIGGKNIVLTGCDLRYSATTAIGLGPVDGMEITGCTIHGAGSLLGHYEDVLHTEGARLKVSGCNIAWGGHGLMFCQFGGAVQLLGSHMHDSGGSGITLVREVNGAVVDGCWFERCATQRSPSVRDVGSAGQIHGNKHVFRGCVFKDNSKNLLFSATGPGTDNPTTSDNLIDRCTLLDAEETSVEMQEAAPSGEIARNVFRACIISGAKAVDLLSCWFSGVGAGSAGASNRFEGCQINRGRIRGTLGTFDTVEAAARANPSVYASCSSGPLANTGSTLTAPPTVGSTGGGSGGGGGTTVPTKPTLTSLTPSTVKPGDTVTAVGALFGVSPILVMQTKKPSGVISSARVPVSSSDDKRVVWKVPDGSDPVIGVGWSGGVYVRNTQLNLTSDPLLLTVNPGGSANKPPVANAGGPYVGVVGQPVQFDGSGSFDLDGTIARYLWTFGGSITKEGARVSHTFDVATTATVTLTVTDNLGATHTATTTATITAAPPPTLKVGVVAEAREDGAFGTFTVGGSVQPLPAGSTITVTARTPDGRTATGVATIAGTVTPPDENRIEDTFEFMGSPADQALLRSAFDDLHYPWGSMKPGLQRVGLTKVRVEFADLTWAGAALTTTDGELVTRATVEGHDDEEDDHLHVVWSGMLPGVDGDVAHFVVGLAWTSGLLQIEQSVKGNQALVRQVTAFEASHHVDFFYASVNDMHPALLAIVFQGGPVTHEWWGGQYPNNSYWLQPGESFMAALQIAYGDHPAEDSRFTPYFRLGQAGAIRAALRQPRTDGKT